MIRALLDKSPIYTFILKFSQTLERNPKYMHSQQDKFINCTSGNTHGVQGKTNHQNPDCRSQ